MGKMKNAKRNPGIRWAELREVFRGDTLETHGERYVVLERGRLGGRFVLESESGVKYTMNVRENGVVDHPVMYL